mmetsp:Transcript_10567/g.23305  ORF Transcript_10567/g.23305 Transcript_10567/m.23305 type:complete len:462 (-) Transcript_10567:34-1419(-)|eukprot:CAMPEP_0204272972 /NCGR_PEP_ID=MMETSP0468-20130131/22390_1 /ASSEMBLY_ACC=CAM_ASM_000383 /TAXON_ID=2969 /ORGANISM="Oxyrrhis marina" /LENGTH=461 /DNA_ID=CAMNT_0051248891 /DNA_START=121 /DNA_END=1506 /DNA_ORIENTATION=-
MSPAEVLDRERYAAEFVGTFVLVFTVGCSVLSGSPAAVIAIGSVLMVLVFSLLRVSGAMFNPAVTLGVFLMKPQEFPLLEAVKYSLIQLAAGVVAGVSIVGWFGNPWSDVTVALGPCASCSWVQAAVVEFLYTFLLVFVVLNTAGTKGYGNSKEGSQAAGLAIGFTVIGAGLAAGWISGGAFNPAVALGVDIIGFRHSFGWSLVYWVFQLAGACVAATLTMVVRPEDSRDSKAPLGAKIAAELIGTFVLVFTVGLNVVQGSGNAGGVVSIAAILLVLIYALGDVSGGHFNPAVTVAVYAAGGGRMESVGEALQYIAAQFIAGLGGGLSYAVLSGVSFGLGPGRTFTWTSVVIVELVFTFVLAFVVLATATLQGARARAHSDIFALAIGFTVIVGGYAIGAVSGGVLNPAVALGIDSAHAVHGGAFGGSGMYALAEVLGGAIAAGVFYATHASQEYQKGLLA